MHADVYLVHTLSGLCQRWTRLYYHTCPSCLALCSQQVCTALLYLGMHILGSAITHLHTYMVQLNVQAMSCITGQRLLSWLAQPGLSLPLACLGPDVDGSLGVSRVSQQHTLLLYSFCRLTLERDIRGSLLWAFTVYLTQPCELHTHTHTTTWLALYNWQALSPCCSTHEMSE